MARGGQLILYPAAEHLIIGAPQEWDEIAILEYPSRDMLGL